MRRATRFNSQNTWTHHNSKHHNLSHPGSIITFMAGWKTHNCDRENRPAMARQKSRRRLVDFHETHYYLSSLDWSATQFSDAIRGHWLIENRLHWVKDVTLNEDNCIHRGGNAPANWAMVRQFLVSIARMIGTNTLPQALRLMANQFENVSELLFGLSHRDKPVKFSTPSSANSPIP